MKKAKWYGRAIYIAVALALTFSLAGVAAPASVAADPGTTKWTKYTTPTDDDKFILPASDIVDYAVTGDDGETIYAIGYVYVPDDDCDCKDMMGKLPRLWKSEDGGVTWDDITDEIQDFSETDVTVAKNLPEVFTDFTAIAAAPDDPDFLVIAGYGDSGTMTVGSNDGGDDFSYMGDVPDTDAIILCLAVSMEIDDVFEVAAGTVKYDGDDLDEGMGEIWRYQAGGYWGGVWGKAGTPEYPAKGYEGWDALDAVLDIEFSPDFDMDEAVVALGVGNCTHEDYADNPYKGYKLVGGIWDNQDQWNGVAGLNYPVTIENEGNIIMAMTDLEDDEVQDFIEPFFLALAGDIVLPYDFNADSSSDRVVMTAINGIQYVPSTKHKVDEGGYIFFVEDSYMCCELLALEDNPLVASIDYHGSVDMEGKAMAGLAFADEDWTFDDVEDWYYDGDDDEPYMPECGGVEVLRSEAVDVCCPDWDWSSKDPSGQFFAIVAYTPDGDMGYASTMGDGLFIDDYEPWHSEGRSEYYADESAFSVSGHVDEVGKCWNQIGLIDTDIDYLPELAVNPACGYVFLNSINLGDCGQVSECDSIWRSDDDAETYMRVWHGLLTDYPDNDPYGYNPEMAVLGLAPEEEDEVETIYMADRGTETVYYADNSGLCSWTSRDSGLDHITDIAVADESTVYALDYNGDAVVSENHARRWSSAKKTGAKAGHTIVVWGDHVLVGGAANGKVAFSDDGVDNFSELDDIGNGNMHVAFDSYYPDNDYVYTAVSDGGSDNNIYRTTIADADFEDMNAIPSECRVKGAGSDLDITSTTVGGSIDFYGIAVSDADGNPATDADTGGILYVSYVAWDDGNAYSGVARVLNPASELCCDNLSWDYLRAKLSGADSLSSTINCDSEDEDWEGVEFFGEPDNLDLCGCLSAGTDTTLWSIDYEWYYWTYDFCDEDFGDTAFDKLGRVWVYDDCFSKAGPELITVEDGATVDADECLCTNAQFVLSWERQCNACEYQIQIARDETFNDVVVDTTEFDYNTYCDIDTYEPAKPASPSVVIDTGMLEPGTDYFWRIRSFYSETDEIIRSQWSDKWRFTVAMSAAGEIDLTSPDDGASNLPLEGIVFTWTRVSGASSYEFTLMDSAGAEVDSATIDAPASSYVFGGSLSNDSAYMWEVKALMDGNVVSESGTATFRTMPEAVPPPEMPEYPAPELVIPEPTTPSWVWVVIGIGAVLVILVIVLIFRTRRV